MEDARASLQFGAGIEENFASIKAAAEGTTRVGKLIHIGQYAVGPLRHLRFNYTTGDAAGQNMTVKATFAACEWIKAHFPPRSSSMNMLLTRGWRVVGGRSRHP